MGTLIATDSPYLADNTGATDATTAIQDALDDLMYSGGLFPGGKLVLPAGQYRLDGQANPHGSHTYNGATMLTGLFLEQVAGTDNTPGDYTVEVEGESLSTRLILNNNNMIGVHCAGSHHSFRNLCVYGNTTFNGASADWTKNQIGFSISPYDFDDISTVFRNSWAMFDRVVAANCRIGFHLMSGGSSNSSIYRNELRSFRAYECGIGTFLESNANGSPPSVNRNRFYSYDANWTHVGWFHETGDTNFISHIEVNNTQVPGPGTPIVPSGTATGIYMLSNDPNNGPGAGWANSSNYFMNVPNEANDRDIYLEPGTTMNSFVGFLGHNDTSSVPDDGQTWNFIQDRIGNTVIAASDTFYINSSGYAFPWNPTGNMRYDFQTDELKIKKSDGTWGVLSAGSSAAPSADDQYTTTDRDTLITSPFDGQRIWNLTESRPEQWNGTAWVEAMNADGKKRTT